MSRLLGAFVLWCAAGIYFVCAYPMSPPGVVPGLSSYKFSLALFALTSVVLIWRVFCVGAFCPSCSKREGTAKRLAYIWLSFVVLCASFGVYDLVSRGAASLTLPLLVIYGLGGFVMISIFFILRYWKGKAGREEQG